MMQPNPNHQQRLIREGADLTARWLTSAVREEAQEESPAADDLVYCVRLLLHEEVRSGRIVLRRDQQIRHGSYSGAWYEVDLVVQETKSGARGGIDVDGYSKHDRDRVEFAASRRRVREIRHTGLLLEVVAADEVRENPWQIALEVVDMIGTLWGSMTAVVLPPEIRAKAEEYARACAARLDHAAMKTPAPAGLPTLEEIRTELAALPVPVDAEFSDVRRRHPRCGAPYTARELDYLQRLSAARVPMHALEQAMLRPASALKRQLRRMGN